MKKLLCLMISLMLLMMIMPGCASQEDEQPSEDAASTQEQTEDTTSAQDQTGDDVESVDMSTLSGNGVDVDLTQLSGTMVYAVVNEMITKPNEYIGKKVRMIGLMSIYHDEENDKTYYACIIQDATACCSQGIEFETTDEFDPADYPKNGEIVTVVGTYDLYEENGYNYAILKDAVLE